MSEVWLPVVGYEGMYEVSSEGRVRSLDRTNARGFRLKGRMLSICLSGGGYPSVGLCKNGRQRTYTTASLVLSAFVQPRPPGLHVLHENDVKTDNTPKNLYYGTHAENMRDRLRNGNHPFAKKEMCKCGRPYDKKSAAGARQCSFCLNARARERSAKRPCGTCGGPKSGISIRDDGTESQYCAPCRDAQMEKARLARKPAAAHCPRCGDEYRIPASGKKVCRRCERERDRARRTACGVCRRPYDAVRSDGARYCTRCPHHQRVRQ